MKANGKVPNDTLSLSYERGGPMIRCPGCGGVNTVKNGHNPRGKQQYRCGDCGRSGVVEPFVRYPESEKKAILNAYREGHSLRGVERIFGVTRQTLAVWLKRSGEGDRRHQKARAAVRRHSESR